METLENSALILGENGLLYSLGEAGMPIILGSELPKNPLFHSKYVKNHFIFSNYESDQFINELCEIAVDSEKKPVIFSDDDRAILNISRNRKKLSQFYLFLYPSEDIVENILDKQKFNKIAKLYDLPIPVSFHLTTEDDFMEVADRITYPCIIKPAQRHFWWGQKFKKTVGFYKKAIKCSNFQKFKELYSRIAKINPNVVVQEYVEGEDQRHYSANLLVDKEGKLRGYYVAQKLRIYPVQAGTGTYVITVQNSSVLNLSLDIVRKLKLQGLVNIQFKQDSRTNEYKLMEIHARNSLWSLLGAKSKANLSYIYYQYLTGGALLDRVIEAKPGVKYFSIYKDIRAYLEYKKAGKITLKEWLSSLRGERVFADISWRDPWPMLFKMWYVLLNRLKSMSL